MSGQTPLNSAAAIGDGVPSAYVPLRRPVFRALWIASLASNLGTWLQNVGAGWLMTGLTPSPLMAALVQAATTFPVFLLALPAGALADVIDRRRLLLAAQLWMLISAAMLAAATACGIVTPWILLILTFALGLGFALNAPAWQAIVPELVPRTEVAAAIALNGVSMNASRAIGPAIGGILVAAAGPEVAFLLNALSFLAVLWVLFRWARPAVVATLPAERLVGAMRAGVRYLRNAPDFQAVLIRTAAFVSGAAGLWALLPAISRENADWGPAGYGVMLGALGGGAVLGTLLLPVIHKKSRAEVVVACATVLFAAGTTGLVLLHELWIRCLLLLPAGAAWLAGLTTLNSSAQSLVPAWVRARALSIYLLVFFGGMAVGSVVWGFIADSLGVPTALVASASWMVAALVISSRYRLPTRPPDVGTGDHWPEPPSVAVTEHEHGPVLVTIEYCVPADRINEFRLAIDRLRATRLRNGAVSWNLFRDAEDAERFVEVFLIESWVEHLRQHERVTVEDQTTQLLVRELHAGDSPPRVTHLLTSTK